MSKLAHSNDEAMEIIERRAAIWAGNDDMVRAQDEKDAYEALALCDSYSEVERVKTNTHQNGQFGVTIFYNTPAAAESFRKIIANCIELGGIKQ